MKGRGAWQAGLAGWLACAALSAHGQTTVTVTQMSYDGEGRLICKAERLNPAAFASPPANACALGAEGPYGPDRVTKNTYDAAGQLLEIDRAQGALNQKYDRMTYDIMGRKLSDADANGNLTTYAYDPFGHLQTAQYPSSSLPAAGTIGVSDPSNYEGFVYDAVGNRTSFRRRDGNVISYGYDALNRVTSQRYTSSAALNLTFAYDLQSHKTAASFVGGGSNVTWSFDALGRVTQTVQGSATLGMKYDAANNRTQLTLPDSNTYAFAYDAANHLNHASFGAVGVLPAYDSLGRLSGITRTNGHATSFTYDGLDRLTDLSQTFAGGTGNVAWTYQYTPSDQVTTSVTSNNAYLWSVVTNGKVQKTYDGLNQDASATYDKNGNLTSDGTRTFQYDGDNRLIVETGPGVSMTLAYDAAGRLDSTTINGTYTKLVWDGDALVAEENSLGGILRRYLNGETEDDPYVWFEGSNTGTPYYLITDRQGSVVGYSDSTGDANTIYTYSPYGQPTVWGGSRYRYTGQIEISAAQLYYYKARVYDPVSSRFLQTDPVGYKDNLDLYAYVGDDPVDRVDPMGLNACGTSNDSGCVVTITIRDRSKGEDGKYNDQFTKVKGQANYNATVSVSVNGELAGTYLGKTTPSDPKKSGTVANGVYSGTFVMHHGKYAAIAFEPSNHTPTTGPNPQQGGSPFAADIQIHHAGVDNFTGVGRDGRPVSEGCTVICTIQYPSFERATGIVPSAGTPQNHFTIDLNTRENEQ
jgi:RHS repeat-associated protein